MVWKKIAEAHFLPRTSLPLAIESQMEEIEAGGGRSSVTEANHLKPELLSQGTEERGAGRFPPHLGSYGI